jgi:hypothetical protein
VCAHLGNQESHGVVIAKLQLFFLEPSSSMSTSPPIDLPLPHGRSGSNLSSLHVGWHLVIRVFPIGITRESHKKPPGQDLPGEGTH